MKNEMNYTDSELEDLRVVSREIMDAEIEAIRAEVEAEQEHAESEGGSAIKELKRIIRTIREMDDEYNRDEECDYTKINGFIELLSEQADEATENVLRGKKGNEE